MARLKLKSVYIRNFASIAEIQLDFPETGFILIVGQNDVGVNKFKSIGAGKSALGEAINRAIFGVPGKYTRLGNYSRYEKGNTFIKIDAEVDSTPLLIEYGFQCPELGLRGEGLRFTLGNDEPIQRGNISGTRAELTAVVGLPDFVASWTVAVDGNKLDFEKLSEEEAVNLVMSVLDQPPWTKYHEKAKSALSMLNLDLSNAEYAQKIARTQHEKYSRELADAELTAERAKIDYDNELKARQQQQDKFNKLEEITNQELDELKSNKKDILTKISKIENSEASNIKNLELEKIAISGIVTQTQEKLKKSLTARTIAEQAVKTAKNQLKKFNDEPDTCPTCGHPWTKKHKQEEIDQLIVRIKSLETSQKTAIEDYNAVDLELNAAVEKLDEINRSIQTATCAGEIRKLSKDIEILERSIATKTNLLASQHKLLSNPIKSETAKIETKIIAQEKLKQVKEAETKLNEAGELLSDCKISRDIAKYWVDAYGPTGIPNLNLRNSVPALNSSAQNLSNKLTGGLLNLEFSMSKQLKSGATRAELTINIINKQGSCSAVGGSKGESGLTKLLIVETLTEVGNIANRINYRWFDEVVPNQDESVQHGIFSYLKSLSSTNLIFVVDHSPIVHQYADHILVAKKTENGTEYFWER